MSFNFRVKVTQQRREFVEKGEKQGAGVSGCSPVPSADGGRGGS
jgi:hypothetical protein